MTNVANADGRTNEGNHARPGRSPLVITLSVWKALLLREALSRLFSGRAVWFWLVAEPVFHVSYMLVIFTVIRVSKVGGIDTAVWLMVGFLAFFMFRNTGTQVMNPPASQ